MRRTQRCGTEFITILVSHLYSVICLGVRGPAGYGTHAPAAAALRVADFALPLGELFIGDKLIHVSPLLRSKPSCSARNSANWCEQIRGILRLKAERIVWCFRSAVGCHADRGPGLFPRRGCLLLCPEVPCVSIRTLLRQPLPLTVSVFSVPLTVYGQAICSGILEQTDWTYRQPRSTGVLCSSS